MWRQRARFSSRFALKFRVRFVHSCQELGIVLERNYLCDRCCSSLGKFDLKPSGI